METVVIPTSFGVDPLIPSFIQIRSVVWKKRHTVTWVNGPDLSYNVQFVQEAGNN
jgi:hypothetical protein